MSPRIQIDSNSIKRQHEEIFIPPLDLPNERPWFQRITTSIKGFLFRGLIDVVSLPIYLIPDEYRYRVTIDTGSTGKCRLCIYVPRNVDGHLSRPGVIVHLHGGGWLIGRPETEAPLCRYLADHVGAVVVAPDYWKTPQYPFPFALEQCYSVLSWINSGGLALSLDKSPHPTLQIDSSRIALSGGSAGSNLACALTVLTIIRPLVSEFPQHTLPNSSDASSGDGSARIVANGLLYPSLNLSVPYTEKRARVDPSKTLPPWMSLFFLHAYLPPPRMTSHPLVSPALAPPSVLSQFPPTVILTAEYDYLAYEAEDFATKLREAGVKDVKGKDGTIIPGVISRRFENVGHGFDGIPTLDKNRRMLNKKARDVAWGMIAETFRGVLL